MPERVMILTEIKWYRYANCLLAGANLTIVHWHGQEKQVLMPWLPTWLDTGPRNSKNGSETWLTFGWLPIAELLGECLKSDPITGELKRLAAFAQFMPTLVIWKILRK